MAFDCLPSKSKNCVFPGNNNWGYYKENEFGIRCENLILVKQIDAVNGKKLLGFENLTLVPFDVSLMDMSILMDPEIQWINKYMFIKFF